MIYTYLWLREDGTPYYVGKGKNGRAFQSSGRKQGKVPEDLSYVLLQEFPTEEEAFTAEKFLISYYGRKDLGTGCLINLTDGGDGRVGVKISEETRKKLRVSHKNKTISEETRQRMSVSQKRVQQNRSQEWRKNISLSKLGSKNPNFIHGQRVGAHARSRTAG